MINVGILAYNEEKNIRACIESVDACLDGLNGKIWVIVNGSTDATADIVRSIMAENSRVGIRELAVGDKSNAWNEFIHELGDDAAEFHVLIDGDVRILPGSLQAMSQAFAQYPDALAASAVPHGGRTSAEWRTRILREHGLPGNFYALSQATVRRLRQQNFRFPFGMIGDDTFLLWILRRNFDPRATPRKEWIRPVADAGFEYDSFEMTIGGVRAHVRRLSRYAVRDVEVKLLIDQITADGLEAMPKDIRQLYHRANILSQFEAPYGKSGYNHRKLFFLLTWLRMKRRALP